MPQPGFPNIVTMEFAGMNTACRPMFVAVVFLISAVCPLPVAGQTLPGFKTPSNNIFCLVQRDVENDPAAYLRCDIMQTTSPRLQKPSDCPLDWGDSFSIARNGRAGEMMCHGDTVRDDKMPVLAYGAAWRREGFTCMSQTDGLTCVNGEGHGFMVSRAVQRLF
jgi:hypothetical protein